MHHTRDDAVDIASSSLAIDLQATALNETRLTLNAESQPGTDPTDGRIVLVQQALRGRLSVEEVHEATGIDPWFLDQIVLLNEIGDAVRAAMGSHAWALPVLVIHGGKDAVVNVRNADETARQFSALHDMVRGDAGQAPLVGSDMPTRVEHGYTVHERRWSDADGRAAVTLVRVDELGHAWSGGSPTGTFTDSAGPNASHLIATFIAQHARPVAR